MEAEVKTQLDKMAANRAKGPDDLPVEVIKLLNKKRYEMDNIMLQENHE